MTRRVVTFDDFSAGEYGLLGGQHAPPHSFTASNMVMLHDGSLCPRMGLLDMAYTGVPTGTVLGYGYHLGQDRLWFIVGTTVYDVPASTKGAAVRTLGTLAVTPTKRIRSFAQDADHSYITVNGDKGYDLYHGAGSLAAIAAAPGGRSIAVYGDRLVIAGLDSPSYRVYFSAAADFTSWPVANYFDVPTGYTIIALAPHRDRLLIAKDDGSWSVLSGVPGVNDVLRRMEESIRPGDTTSGMTRWAKSGDGKTWMCPEGGEYPAFFGGSSVQVFEHLSLTQMGDTGPSDTGSAPKVGVTALLEPSDVFMCIGGGNTAADNQGLLFTNGTWTKHAYDVDITGWVEGRGLKGGQRRVMFCSGGGASAKAKFYSWTFRPDRPAFSSHIYESIGDASTTPPAASVTTPEWWIKDQEELQAVAVVVDFTKWNHGFSANNAFAVTLTPLYRDGGTAALAGGNATAISVGSFSEAASVASTAGTADRRRWTLPPSAQFANGFKVTVSGVVGCAIKKIHIVMDTRPMQAV